MTCAAWPKPAHRLDRTEGVLRQDRSACRRLPPLRPLERFRDRVAAVTGGRALILAAGPPVLAHGHAQRRAPQSRSARLRHSAHPLRVAAVAARRQRRDRVTCHHRGDLIRLRARRLLPLLWSRPSRHLRRIANSPLAAAGGRDSFVVVNVNIVTDIDVVSTLRHQ